MWAGPIGRAVIALPGDPAADGCTSDGELVAVVVWAVRCLVTSTRQLPTILMTNNLLPSNRRGGMGMAGAWRGYARLKKTIAGNQQQRRKTGYLPCLPPTLLYQPDLWWDRQAQIKSMLVLPRPSC